MTKKKYYTVRVLNKQAILADIINFIVFAYSGEIVIIANYEVFKDEINYEITYKCKYSLNKIINDFKYGHYTRESNELYDFIKKWKNT